MRSRFNAYVALAVVAPVLLASCADNRRTAALSVCAVSEAPPALLTIDERSQQILRLASSTRDWPQIDAYIAEIDDAWIEYSDAVLEPAAQSASEPSPAAAIEERVAEAIGELKEAAARRSAQATTTAASRLDAAAVELYEHHHAAVTPNLRRLAVLERRILIDLSSEAYESALRTLDCAQDVWHRVQPRIQTRAGFHAAQTLDGQFVVQRTALNVRDRPTVIASVETMLQLIDGIENLY